MYVNVFIDEDDVLSDISDRKLLAEVKRRKLRAEGDPLPPNLKECVMSLESAALELRKQNKVNLAYRLDEIKYDYFEGGLIQ